MAETLERAIRAYAAENALTLDNVATSLGVVRSTLYNWFDGNHRISLDDGVRLAQLLGCGIEEVCEMCARGGSGAAGNG